MKTMNRTVSIPGWYVEFQADVLRQLPRPRELDQTTAEGWSSNQKALKNVLASVLLPSQDKPVADSRFTPLTTFQITVPGNYDHSIQLASFREENHKKFFSYNNNITDANFARATNKLVPGKTYEAKIFKITKKVTSEDCLAFLKTQKAILVGAQGISIVWQQAKEQFPKNKWTISFDEKDALWQDADGTHGVSDVSRYSVDGWSFFLGSFEESWGVDYCVLCLCDFSA